MKVSDLMWNGAGIYVAPEGTDSSVVLAEGFWDSLQLPPGKRIEVMAACGSWFAEFIVRPNHCGVMLLRFVEAKPVMANFRGGLPATKRH